MTQMQPLFSLSPVLLHLSSHILRFQQAYLFSLCSSFYTSPLPPTLWCTPPSRPFCILLHYSVLLLLDQPSSFSITLCSSPETSPPPTTQSVTPSFYRLFHPLALQSWSSPGSPHTAPTKHLGGHSIRRAFHSLLIMRCNTHPNIHSSLITTRCRWADRGWWSFRYVVPAMSAQHASRRGGFSVENDIFLDLFLRY